MVEAVGDDKWGARKSERRQTPSKWTDGRRMPAGPRRWEARLDAERAAEGQERLGRLAPSPAASRFDSRRPSAGGKEGRGEGAAAPRQ